MILRVVHSIKVLNMLKVTRDINQLGLKIVDTVDIVIIKIC